MGIWAYSSTNVVPTSRVGFVTVEVWLRNPNNYIKEAMEVGHTDFAWDFGVLKKRRIDPFLFGNLYLGSTPWRCIVFHSVGSSLHDNDHDMDNPVAVWPTWDYGESWDRLMELILNPVGEDYDACHDINVPTQFRPVYGQEHRVMITKLPSVSTGAGRRMHRMISDLQLEHPEVKLHLHGSYSYRVMFGMDFESVDIDPRTIAAKDNVMLPNGKKVSQPGTTEQPHWVQLLGMTPVSLKIPRNRCIFNIKSALWAAEHYQEAVRFKHKGFQAIDPDDPFSRSPTSHTVMVRSKKPSPGDKWLCNTCNLQTVCKFYREGAVCIVPESEPVRLAQFFKTRDSETIIEGLGTLLATQSNRLEKAVEMEEEQGSLNPETRKIINDLFDRGVKLAKLVDPVLAAAGAAKVTTNNLTQINAANPQELMAAVMDEFVKKGIPRSQVTPEMVMAILETPEESRQKAIDAAAEEAAS